MSSTDSNTTARPVCCSSFGLAAECLITAPRGARLPCSTAIAPSGLIGLSRGRITSCPGTSSAPATTSRKRRAGDGPGIEVDQVAELRHQLRHAAGMMEMLHVVLARRLQVDQHRHLAAEPVEGFEIDAMRGAAGDRGEMDQAVGRAADRLQHHLRIAEGGRRQDFARASAPSPSPSRPRPCRWPRRSASARHAAPGWSRSSAATGRAPR